MGMIKRATFCILIFLLAMNEVSAQSNLLGDHYLIQATNFKKNLNTDSALIYYEKAAVEFQKLSRIEKWIDVYNQIGIILTRQDKYDQAKTYLTKALKTGLDLLDANNLTLSTTYISLGVIYNAEGDYKQSLAYHFKALDIRIIKLGESNAEVATSYGNIGNVYRNAKELEKSIAAHLKAMKIRKEVFGPTSAEVVESYVGLGNAYREKKEYATALTYFDQALKNKIAQRGVGHKDLVRFYKFISNTYYLMDNKLKGDEFKNKGEEIEKSNTP
jgi:tetratricopeptide (TPR) repeat protein